MSSSLGRDQPTGGRDDEEDVDRSEDTPETSTEHRTDGSRPDLVPPRVPSGARPSPPGFARVEAVIDDNVVLADLRVFVRNAVELLQTGPFENLVLLSHELVKNALALDEAQVRISLQRVGTLGVRVEVRDYGYGLPVLDRGPGGELGLGLTIVDRLADRWGVDQFLPGKIVWFELDTPRLTPVPP